MVVKPVGCRRASQPRLERTDRHRRARRRRILHRHLRCGGAAGHRAPAGRRHVRADGGRQVGARLHAAQAAVPGADRGQALPRARPGPPRSAQRHHRRTRRAAPAARLQVGRHRGGQAVRHALRPHRGVPGGQSARHQAGDGAHAPDPGAHVRAPAPLRRRPHLRRRSHAGQAAAAGAAVAARGQARLRAPVGRALGGVREHYPDDLQLALDRVRAESA